ncbi:MAG: LysR family transcriptional regulator [Nitratireductor sp.]|nr:LysR family transcriptional regulator [Nitratireductor sp.]
MNFATFDLNLLRVLDALLREGSTVKAGERLGMSQSAVSGALARLRHALGDQLFVRHGQGLRPTDYAVSLSLPLNAELARLEALLAPPAFDPAASTMSFKLAGADFFAEMLMPELAQKLRITAPQMRMQLIDLVPNSYLDSLERYEADMALMPDLDFPEWTDRRPLFHSSYAVIAAADNPVLAGAGAQPGDVLDMDLFCEMGHLLFSPEGKHAAAGDAALARVGRSRRVVMTMPVFSGICRVVGESELISLIPRQLAERLAPSQNLAIYKPPMPIEPALIVGVWHKRSTDNPAHRWMRGVIADILLPLNEGERPVPV